MNAAGFHLVPLRESTDPWRLVSDELPEVLEDVLVSALVTGDDEPIVFMGYRKRDGQWYFTSADDQVISGVYAWRPVPAPLPMPARQVAP